ncbi:hypothetical protein SLOPH_782 [Spraguea lophii 42_110]|uniref:Uncharacterized protein n=1 Tax=Spraguea lophii (strain 42_110) TaxID=1358809 RepID=S7W982_SPRLO|nr:hypothetical protein SLOPH_782 [Spraguea lophii 42_110]
MYLFVFFISVIYSTANLIDYIKYILEYGNQLKQCSDLKGIDLNNAISKMAVRHKHRIRIAMKQLKARDEPTDNLIILLKAFGDASEMTMLGIRIKPEKKDELIELIKKDLVFEDVEFLMGIYNISSVFNPNKIMEKTPKNIFDDYCESLIVFINNGSYICENMIKVMDNCVR